jgi:hypothetical protein
MVHLVDEQELEVRGHDQVQLRIVLRTRRTVMMVLTLKRCEKAMVATVTWDLSRSER